MHFNMNKTMRNKARTWKSYRHLQRKGLCKFIYLFIYLFIFIYVLIFLIWLVI